MYEDILKLNDSDFEKKIMEDKQILKDNLILEHLFELPVNKIINIIKSLDIIDFETMMNTNSDLLNKNLNLIVLNSPDEVKKQMINNETILKTILLASPNRNKKTIFDLLNNEFKAMILAKFNYINIIDENMYQKLLSKISNDELTKIYNYFACENLQINPDYLKNYVIKNFDIDENKTTQLVSTIISKGNFLFLYKVKNETQLNIYSKFGILVDANKKSNNIEINNIIIPDYILENINSKNILSLIDKIKNKEQITDYNKLFIVVIKLYCKFGYDNTAKIIDDKFSTMTQSAVEKAALNDFIDYRRQYRLENQDLFYSNDLFEMAKIAINKNDIGYFKRIFGINDDLRVENKLNIIKSQMKESKSPNDILAVNLKEEITKRETTIKKNYVIKYCTNYINNYGISNFRHVSLDVLYDKFKDLDISNIKLDEHGRPEINEALNKFIFGNFKVTNDCLLRLVFNNQALGLNDNLSTVINNFSKIKRIIDKSDGKLSIDSILDVIDIFKVLFYKLEPNEQDMTLATVSKIMRSMEYCTESKEEIFKRARKLHVERRQKSYATIPSVSNNINGVSYKVLNFDDDSLITLGIDTGCCLKVGGKGEDFLNYCLKSPHAVILELKCKGERYICPFVRNGNGVYGNGIEPKPKDEETANLLLNALKEFGNSIINKSFDSEKIEFVTITDLHQTDFFEKQDCQCIKVDYYLPIDSVFYADYNKPEIKNYVIASVTNNIYPKFYVPEAKFYQNRSENYRYSSEIEEDKERIMLKLNSINYDLIDCMNISQNKKNTLKRKYVSLNIDDYDYIVGNKDWFIAVNEFNILSGCLPYDERARVEFQMSLNNIKKIYEESSMVKQR